MKKATTLLLTAVLCCWSVAIAQAVPMAGQYSINATATQSNLDLDTWTFTYQITNNNQQTYSRTGLDGFYIQIPEAATIVAVTTPASYSGYPGEWVSGNQGAGNNFWAAEAATATDYTWYCWWGLDPASVYPGGTTASFTITLDGVEPGVNPGVAVTYWGFSTPPPGTTYTTTQHGHYSGYSSNLLSPVPYEPEPVPEPATMLLFGTGLAGLARLTSRKKA